MVLPRSAVALMNQDGSLDLCEHHCRITKTPNYRGEENTASLLYSFWLSACWFIYSVLHDKTHHSFFNLYILLFFVELLLNRLYFSLSLTSRVIFRICRADDMSHTRPYIIV